MAWAALVAPGGRRRGAATTGMGVIAEERQRRGRPRAATNPLGTWGLRPHASLLVVNDATHIVSSSRLAWDSQAPCARPMRLLGQAPGVCRRRPERRAHPSWGVPGRG